MTKKLKILHLLHDPKFISFIEKFSYPGVSNDYIYINEKFEYNGIYKEEMQHVIPFSKSFFKLPEAISFKYDFIFVYNLEYNKAFLINRISKKDGGKIIWNFFGTEIYNNPNYPFFKNLYDVDTKKLMKPKPKINYKRYLRWAKYSSKGRVTPRIEIEQAIKRIDYFAWYSNEEYEYLRRQVNLPPFLHYPLERLVPIIRVSEKTEFKLLLGNSKSPENNHLGILMLLEEVNFDGTILIPFSYGSDSYYTAALQKHISFLKIKVKLINEFLPYDKYVSELSNCNIAVYNSFRQMALGNILISLVNGAKVYLSEKNISYLWFKNLGFILFSIEKNLKNDLINKTLLLSSIEKTHNLNLYYQVTDEKRIQLFMELLKKLS